MRCLLKSDFRTTFSCRSLDLSDIWVYPHQIHDYRQNNSHPEEQFVTDVRGMKQVISNATPYFPCLTLRPNLRFKKKLNPFNSRNAYFAFTHHPLRPQKCPELCVSMIVLISRKTHLKPCLLPTFQKRLFSASNAQACDQEFKLFFALSEKNEMTKASQEEIFFYFLSDQGIVVKLTLSDVLILVPVPLLAFLRYRKIIA